MYISTDFIFYIILQDIMDGTHLRSECCKKKVTNPCVYREKYINIYLVV